WRGTAFFRRGAIRSSHSKRSSSQPRTLRGKLISGLPSTPHEYLVPAHLYLKTLQGARRRTRNISAVEIVLAVMAGTPDLAQIVAVLHCAGQMRASRRHGAILSAGSADQQTRVITKPENLSTVRLQLRKPGGDDLVPAEICHRRRDKIAEHGINERNKRGKQAAAEEDSNHAAARRFGLGKLVSGHSLRPLPQENSGSGSSFSWAHSPVKRNALPRYVASRAPTSSATVAGDVR